jgi:hypothetical protein
MEALVFFGAMVAFIQISLLLGISQTVEQIKKELRDLQNKRD